MSKKEFSALHSECKAVMDSYLAEMLKTWILMGNCKSEPLSFSARFALLSQEILEKDAHLTYLESKRILHRAALAGYAATPKGWRPAPQSFPS